MSAQDATRSRPPAPPAWGWVLEFVVCPICRRTLVIDQLSDDGRDGVVGHAGGICSEVYPVIDGIVRLLSAGARPGLIEGRGDWFSSSPFAARFQHWRRQDHDDGAALKLVARFDDEWRAFSRVGTIEQERVFGQYFDVVPGDLLRSGHVVLDAGCGAGRWAFAVQGRGARVVAMDLGRSVELAERSTRDTGRVACVQADVRDLPVRAGAFDLVYSLGVLHHVGPTERAVRGLAKAVRPGGALLIYLYYALDGRPLVYRALYRGVDAVRHLSSRLPHSLLVGLTTALAAFVYFPLARLARLLRGVGLRAVSDSLPLSFYADLSFATMRNDSLDRFGTKLEKRYTRTEVHQMLEGAELRQVVVSDGQPYWHAIGWAAGAE